MKYDQIKAGDKVKITQKNSPDYNKQFYESRVARVHENYRLFEMEALSNCLSLYEKGAVFEFVFFTATGNYCCDCILVRTYMGDDGYLTTIRVVSPVVEANLREHPRYKTDVPLTYSIIGKIESLTDDSAHLCEGRLTDLSGGGVKFLGRTAVEVGSRLRIMIEKSEGSLLAESMVVGCRELEDEGIFKYEIRAQFVQFKNSNRKKQRVKCSLACRFVLISDGDDPYEEAKKPGCKYYDGVIKNISERGLRLASSIELSTGTHLYLEFRNNDIEISTECVVVSNLTSSTKGVYENGVKFISTRKKENAK